jgi:hypothetical protein
MASILPKNHADRIAWFTSRTALWTSNATVIGTTTTQVTAVSTAATAASAALAAQIAAQNASKAATETLNEAMATLTNAGNIVIEQVRTKARTSGDSVYPLANIPAPATPSPVPAPGKPTDLVVTLSETGVLNLKWKCPNPTGAQGTFYQVWRRIGPTADFTFLGTVGSRTIDDNTLPAGSSQVTYQIQASRTTAVGPWAQFNVNFGVSSGGGMTATVTEGTPTKIAA